MKILVIEDELAIRQTLQDLLELNGHEVQVAADGPLGIRLAEGQPDVILSDIGLPGMDGYAVMAAIQQNPVCRDIPFIFLTARAERQDLRKGMASGADDYITKPFTEQEILDALSARVRRQQPLRERVTRLLNQHQVEVGAKWSHELLTPLNGVLGGLELIEEAADSIQPAELRELLRLIRWGAERQQGLAQKLVLYFELEQVKLAPWQMACSAREVIMAGVSRAAQLAQRMADVTAHCETADVPVAEKFLVAAVAELVGNALRFSRPGQRVELRGALQSGGYRIEIVDQGPGLTVAQCAAIGAFVQFDREKCEQQGLGLGLAIARSVAELGGGRLQLKPGSGGIGLMVLMDLAVIPTSG